MVSAVLTVACQMVKHRMLPMSGRPSAVSMVRGRTTRPTRVATGQA